MFCGTIECRGAEEGSKRLETCWSISPRTGQTTRIPQPIPRSTKTRKGRLQLPPTSCTKVTLPKRRIPTQAMKNHAHSKISRNRQNFTRARVCCGLWMLTDAKAKASVHLGTKGKRRKVASRRAKLAGLAIPLLSHEDLATCVCWCVDPI